MASINNHLIIGLGGTGGKVIREFRKLYQRESEINEDNKQPRSKTAGYCWDIKKVGTGVSHL